jgi:hypothetical protein
MILWRGHLHPKLETDIPRPGIEPGPPQWEASTPEKSHPNSLLINRIGEFKKLSEYRTNG